MLLQPMQENKVLPDTLLFFDLMKAHTYIMKNTLQTEILGNATADNQNSDCVWVGVFFSFESKSPISHYNAFWEIMPIICLYTSTG